MSERYFRREAPSKAQNQTVEFESEPVNGPYHYRIDQRKVTQFLVEEIGLSKADADRLVFRIYPGIDFFENNYESVANQWKDSKIVVPTAYPFYDFDTQEMLEFCDLAKIGTPSQREKNRIERLEQRAATWQFGRSYPVDEAGDDLVGFLRNTDVPVVQNMLVNSNLEKKSEIASIGLAKVIVPPAHQARVQELDAKIAFMEKAQGASVAGAVLTLVAVLATDDTTAREIAGYSIMVGLPASGVFLNRKARAYEKERSERRAKGRSYYFGRSELAKSLVTVEANPYYVFKPRLRS